MTKICVLGLGYIGLPTASMFAMQGHDVIGVDVNHTLVDLLRSGSVLIQEPGLHTLVQSALQSGHLHVHGEPECADVFIIAVPTPIVREPGELHAPDLTSVRTAASTVAQHLKPNDLVILESTSPPGTTAQIVQPILEETGLQGGPDFSLAYCAERVLPGRILVELVSNDRIVGGIDARSAQRAADLYATFVQSSIYETDASTAEFVKLMENTFRDVNIALANEFSRVANVIDVDIDRAITLANRHPRVQILQPGPGVGGHCIAVDPWFLVDVAPDRTSLVQAARAVNDSQPHYVADLVGALTADIDRPLVTALGLSYKADVDDLRESPAIEVVRLLRERGTRIRVHDPIASLSPDLGECAHTLEDALDDADLMVILTDHSVYRQLDPNHPGPQRMAHRRILDTRSCIDQHQWGAADFSVTGLSTKSAFRGPLPSVPQSASTLKR